MITKALQILSHLDKWNWISKNSSKGWILTLVKFLQLMVRIQSMVDDSRMKIHNIRQGVPTNIYSIATNMMYDLSFNLTLHLSRTVQISAIVHVCNVSFHHRITQKSLYSNSRWSKNCRPILTPSNQTASIDFNKQSESLPILKGLCDEYLSGGCTAHTCVYAVQCYASLALLSSVAVCVYVYLYISANKFSIIYITSNMLPFRATQRAETKLYIIWPQSLLAKHL